MKRNKSIINFDKKGMKNMKMKKIIKKFPKKKKEFEYNNIRKRWCKESECTNIYNIFF